MKKLFTIIIAILFSVSMYSQERELSNYEKYRLEKEAQMNSTTPDTVYKTDTVYIEVETESTQPVVNNYYIDNEPDIRYRLYFGYRSHYYSYSYYDPFYYDYWGWNYPYYYYSPYYSYNYWYGYNYYRPYYYGHNHYYSYYPITNYYRGDRYYASSSLGRTRNYYNPSYRTYSSGYVSNPRTAMKKAPVTMNRTVTMDRKSNTAVKSTTRPATAVNPRTQTRGTTYDKSPYNRVLQDNRSQTRTRTESTYTPTYKKPEMKTRPVYNNSSTRNRSYTRPSTSSPQKSYTTPPSRSSSSGSVSRSSGSSSKGKR